MKLILPVVLIVLISFSGYFFYQNQQLQKIDKDRVDGSDNPDEFIEKMRPFCLENNYKKVYLNSFIERKGLIVHANSQQVTDDEADLYEFSVRDFCKNITSNIQPEKKRILNETYWQYRYVYTSSISVSNGYTSLDGDWRLVLMPAGRI